MTLEERLINDIKSAMKAGEKATVETLRLLRAQINDARISKRSDLTESEVEQILSTAAKKRRESIELFEKGNRGDLVQKEKKEIDLILSYLPEQLNADELRKIIEEKIDALDVSSEKETGRIMKEIMPELKGKADGKLVQQMVRELLTSKMQ
jgi:uncharacterized protein YqeY